MGAQVRRQAVSQRNNSVSITNNLRPGRAGSLDAPSAHDARPYLPSVNEWQYRAATLTAGAVWTGAIGCRKLLSAFRGELSIFKNSKKNY